jgi:ribokinase
MASVVLPSEQEITEYFGPISAQEGARRLLQLGARVVVVKRGAHGSLLHQAKEQHWRQVPVYPSSAVDTTGAGDAYCGGFLVGLTETGDLLQAALYGTVSASFIIEGFGALHSRLVTRADAEERLARLGGIIQEMG